MNGVQLRTALLVNGAVLCVGVLAGYVAATLTKASSRVLSVAPGSMQRVLAKDAALMSSCGTMLAIQASGVREGETVTIVLHAGDAADADDATQPVAFTGFRAIAWHPTLPVLLLAETDVACASPGYALLEVQSGGRHRLAVIGMSDTFWTFDRWEPESGLVVFSHENSEEVIDLRGLLNSSS